MDALSEKLSELLSNPEALSNIRSMAENLFDEAKEKEPPKENPMGNLDMGKLMMLMNKLNKTADDERTNLLRALKPHLSEERRERAEKAIKILKLIDLLPLLKDSGFLNIF